METCHHDVAIVGWRYFVLRVHDSKVALVSPSRNDTFVPRAPAACFGLRLIRLHLRDHHGPHAHMPPEPSCTCGYYVAKTLETLPSVFEAPDDAVLCKVECYGRVVESERGYRAEKMRVLDVVVPNMCFYCSNLAVDVSTENERVVPVCKEHRHTKSTVDLAAVRASLCTDVSFGAVPRNVRLAPRRIDRNTRPQVTESDEKRLSRCRAVAVASWTVGAAALLCSVLLAVRVSPSYWPVAAVFAVTIAPAVTVSVMLFLKRDVLLQHFAHRREVRENYPPAKVRYFSNTGGFDLSTVVAAAWVALVFSAMVLFPVFGAFASAAYNNTSDSDNEVFVGQVAKVLEQTQIGAIPVEDAIETINVGVSPEKVSTVIEAGVVTHTITKGPLCAKVTAAGGTQTVAPCTNP